MAESDSAQAQETAAPGRPWSRHAAKRRAAILDAAVRVFIRDGFAGATLDAIAAAAKVGKQTVYNHFGDKERLFLAAVSDHNPSLQADIDADPPASGSNEAESRASTLLSVDAEPVTVLTQVGLVILGAVLDPERAALHRLTIAELGRHPELQQIWAGTAGNSVTTAVARYFETMTRAGRLVVKDPDLTARQFVILLAADARARTQYGLVHLGDTDRHAIAEQAADLIVRASR